MAHALSRLPQLSGCCLNSAWCQSLSSPKVSGFKPVSVCCILATSLCLGRSVLPMCYQLAQRLRNFPAPQAPHQTLHLLPVCKVS